MSTETLQVRRAVAADLPEVSRISRAAYLQGGHLREDSHYLETIGDAAARLRDGELFVAEASGVIAGSVVLTRAGTQFAELARPGELEFRVLAVDPAFQGRGIGRALVRHLLDQAVAEEATAMVICSMDTMRTAHRLYLSEGFVRVPERDLVIEAVGRFPTFVHPLRPVPPGQTPAQAAGDSRLRSSPTERVRGND